MRVIVLWALAALLIGCVSTPRVTGPLPPARSWAQRQQLLRQDLRHFTLRGRLAASNGQQGVSAGLRWQQRGSDADLSLSAGPLGLGAARLRLTGGLLRITTSNGEQLSGTAAQERLTALLGFQPPLRSLRYWVLGLSDPSQSAAPSLDERQRLTQLQQGGWSIHYDEYLPVAGQWLPRRLTLSRDTLRLKLVIDAWQL
jgi:outer membrane lipoprotein LolB